MEIFSRKKYYLLTLVMGVLIAGFALMAGPRELPGEFNHAIFNFSRITLAPIIIIGAFASLVFVIFKRS
ncbi:DUF3098 domain-containing protein [Maribellus sediminis]|uniref:DUF3098 domain-containing protein n=1 Tax=Maribellus sediminis TaxID=2696285 RepID=UPI001431F022